MKSSKQDKTISVHPLMTAAEVAQVLSVGERTVWRMASRSRAGAGAFPRPIRIGRNNVRWRWEDVEKYLQKLAEKQWMCARRRGN